MSFEKRTGLDMLELDRCQRSLPPTWMALTGQAPPGLVDGPTCLSLLPAAAGLQLLLLKSL